MSNVYPFCPVSIDELKNDPPISTREEEIYDRKRELIKAWDEDIFSFIKQLNKKDKEIYDELMGDVEWEIFQPVKKSDVLDKAYEVRAFIEGKKETYAEDIASNE